MRNKCKNLKKGKVNEGITLVALVVTIVVLLILAGVSLSLVLNNNGIIKRAGDAETKYEQARINEQNTLNEAYTEIDEILGSGGSEDLTRIDGVPIPNGYYYVGGTKNTGLVISDSDTDENKYKTVTDGKVLKDGLVGNQWVWVPVDNVSKYYENSSKDVEISESTVTTKKYTRTSIEIGTGSNKVTITRGIPNSSNHREPALIGTEYYDNDENAQIAGYKDINDMATKMVSDYDIMIRSIEKYKGFYIGRYELSGTDIDNPREQVGEVLTYKTWYELYKACRKFGENTDGTDKEGITTRMIWGCQWDMTCDFIATKGEQKSIINSSDWGNYNNNTEEGKGTKQITGYSEVWKANNIYDLAGNYSEWTQEAEGVEARVNRGGYYLFDGGGYEDLTGSTFPVYGYSGTFSTYNISGVERYSSHFNNYYWDIERENQRKKDKKIKKCLHSKHFFVIIVFVKKYAHKSSSKVVLFII